MFFIEISFKWRTLILPILIGSSNLVFSSFDICVAIWRCMVSTLKSNDKEYTTIIIVVIVMNRYLGILPIDFKS